MGNCPKCEEEIICFETEKLQKKIQLDIQKITHQEESCEKEINNIEKSIRDIRQTIISEIRKDNNLNIRNEINNYYKVLNELKITKNKYHFDDLINEKRKLINFLEELGGYPNDERIKAIKREYNEIKNKLRKIFFGEGLKKSNNSLLSEVHTIEEFEEESPEKKKLNELFDLNDKIIKEIDGIEEKKIKFENKLNNFQSEYNFSFSLEKYLNNFEESKKSFKNNLISYQDDIKKLIEKIIKNAINLKDVNNEYDALNNKINKCIIEQDNYENQLINEKNKDFENAKIGYIKSLIKLKFIDLRNLINKIKDIKRNLNNNITKCNNLNGLIIQKENKNYFISFQIKDKQEKFEIYTEYKNNINMHINSLNNQINKINTIINKFETLENNDNQLIFLYHSSVIYNEHLNNVQKLINNTNQNINGTNNFLEKSVNFLNVKEEKIKDLIKDYDYIIIDSQKKYMIIYIRILDDMKKKL